MQSSDESKITLNESQAELVPPHGTEETAMPSPEEAMAYFQRLGAGKEAELKAWAETQAKARLVEIIGHEPHEEMRSSLPPQPELQLGDSTKNGLYVLLAACLIIVVSLAINAGLQWLGVTDTLSETISYLPLGLAVFVGGIVLLKQLRLGSRTVYVLSTSYAVCFVAMPIIRSAFQQLGMSRSIASTISDILLVGLGILASYIVVKRVRER